MERRPRQILSGLLVDPLLGELAKTAGSVWTRAGFRKGDLRVIAPLKPERHHPLPGAVTLCGPIITKGPKKPARGAAVVANRDVNLNQSDCAQGTLKARDRPLVSPGRIVVDEHMSLPREGILHDGQLRF